MIKIDSQRGKNPEMPYKKSEILPKDLLPMLLVPDKICIKPLKKHMDLDYSKMYTPMPTPTFTYKKSS